jgi:DNA mismatch endonuclease (patch repair protein)
MTDRLDKAKRSWNMSRIRGKDTKPEIAVRKILHAAGFRYRLHVKDLPGNPDIVLPKWKTAVFVHGCFWHRHDGCKDATIPKTRSEWWDEKLSKNKMRDTLNREALVRAGWRILIVWECSFKQSPAFSDIKINRLREIASDFIVHGSGIFEISSLNMTSSNILCNKKTR